MIFDDYSYLVAGDILPKVRFSPAEGGQAEGLKKGHIILLNFFIIPCKHCKHMLEYLQKEIWPEFRNNNNLLLAIGREHTSTELREFRDKGNYILPFAADPDRKIYNQFAEKKVPRNYLFDSLGRLVYQTRGFDLEQMATMRSILQEMNQA